MKWLSVIALFFSLQTFAADPQSFDLLLTGRTAAGPNANEDAFIRKMIADFVEKLKVKKYILRPTPANGGFRVCIEPSVNGGYDYIIGELNTFAIRESLWEPTLVRNCR